MGESGHLIWIERGAAAIEVLAVALITGFVLGGMLIWLYRWFVRREVSLEYYESYRARIGRSLLLGLELLVAADVVRTVVLGPSLLNIGALGLLVLVRTFLSWSIMLEIEGHWPWQRRPRAEKRDESI
jgi:uncharacterized membrane protein